MARNNAAYRLRVEVLESRLTPADGFRLDIVACHEFGHALGLAHHSNPASIMHDAYNANYDLSALASDPAVIIDPTDGYLSLLEIYTDAAIAANTTGWKDSRDPSPNNGVIDLSFSIMPDGTKIKKKLNVIDMTFTPRFGDAWRGILGSQLGNWAGASQGRLSFSLAPDAGLRFDYPGRSQNDPKSGDIRIGAIPLGGKDERLAQTYAPPPNGKTAPGDVHFNALENWELPLPSPPPVGQDFPIPDGGGGPGDGGGGGVGIGDPTGGGGAPPQSPPPGDSLGYRPSGSLAGSTAGQSTSASAALVATITANNTTDPAVILLGGLFAVPTPI